MSLISRNARFPFYFICKTCITMSSFFQRESVVSIFQKVSLGGWREWEVVGKSARMSHFNLFAF